MFEIEKKMAFEQQMKKKINPVSVLKNNLITDSVYDSYDIQITNHRDVTKIRDKETN